MKFVSVLAVCTILFITGCKDEAPPERIRILGSIPADVNVGTEVFVELGIDGGEPLYQYSLSNHPAWLAVEYNNNPLRPGVILRGVPGLTGGQSVDDIVTLVYPDIILSISDGKTIATRQFSITVSANNFEIEEITRSEAELESRPAREVLNEVTRAFEPEDIAMCMVSADGTPLVTEEDMTYWLGLINRFEVLEEGGAITAEEQAELVSVFGGARPRIVYFNLQLASAVVSDSFFSFRMATTGDPEDTDTNWLTPDGDFLTSIIRSNGETLNLINGFLKVPAGESVCPILVLVNDDREAEDHESLLVQIDNLSTHNYLPSSTESMLTVTDNEPTPGFLRLTGTVTESNNQLGFDSDLQAPGTVYKLTVVLGDVPLQDRTPDNVITAKLAFKDIFGTGSFAPVSSAAEVSGSLVDVVADTSPAYLKALDNAVEVSFYEDTREVEGELVTEWVTERELYFYAPANGGQDALMDDFVTLTWERTATSFENSATHTIWVNQWATAVESILPPNSRAVAVRSGGDGSVYVGYEYVENDITVADIVLFDRTGRPVVTLPLRFGDQSITLADFIVREQGIPTQSALSPDILQEVYVALNVNALVAPPLQSADLSQLGGQDFVVALYRRVNRIGGFDAIWQRQLGSRFDDEVTTMRLNFDNNLYLAGITNGGFGPFTNQGGTDAFIVLLDDDGAVVNSTLYGTTGDDGFLDMATEGTSNALFTGFVGSATELGAGGGGLDIVSASFSDELALRRANQFGGVGDQVMRAVDGLNIGFFAAGTTTNSRLAGLPSGQNDVLISYQRTASQLDSVFLVGTVGEDHVEDVATVLDQGFVAGSTEGSLFEDNVYGGGKDWWLASYDAIQPDPLDSDRGLALAWQNQGGDSRNESIVGLAPTTTGKVFKLTAIEDTDLTRIRVSPVGTTDGRELSELP